MLRENKATYKGHVWYEVNYVKLLQNLKYIISDYPWPGLEELSRSVMNKGFLGRERSSNWRAVMS